MVTQKKDNLIGTFFVVGQCWIVARRRALLEPSLPKCWLRPARNVVAMQEMIARSSLMKRTTILVESEDK